MCENLENEKYGNQLFYTPVEGCYNKIVRQPQFWWSTFCASCGHIYDAITTRVR